MGTHYKEVDFRLDWIRDLFLSLNHGFSTIQNKLNNIDYFDALFAQEQAETVFGIGFVTAQTYITGTISDISEIEQGHSLSKSEMLAIGSPEVAPNVSKVYLVNAIANFFKHHDEWDGWQIESNNRRTINMLNQVGINENIEFPCHKAAQIIWPSEMLCEFSYLLDVLIDWRKNLLIHVKNI